MKKCILFANKITSLRKATLISALLLSACAKTSSDGMVVYLPDDVKDHHEWTSPDGLVNQTTLSLAAKKDDLAQVNATEKKILSRGFVRCDAGSGGWETYRKPGGEVTRLVRFYNEDGSGKLATIAGERKCSEGDICDYVYHISIATFPKNDATAREYVKEICR